MMASVTTVAAAAAVLSLLLSYPMSAQGGFHFQADNTDEVKQEMLDIENEFMALYKNRSFETICNELYTEDCVLYLPALTIARGREECARGWEAMKDNNYQLAAFYNPIIQEVILTSSVYAIERGVIKDSEDQYAKYLVIWKRIGGKLYAFHNILNVNTPYKEPTLLDEITDRRNEWSYYFNTGNFESACSRFTPDCWMAPSGKPPVTGRDGCERLMVKAAVSGVFRIIMIPESYEVYDMGDEYILNHGAWIKYDEAGGELDRLKDMTIWKRLEDGQFYIHFAMWNSDIHF